MPIAQKRTRASLWKDVIFALLLRQLSSKFNDKIGVSWLIIQPVLFILALSLLRGSLDGGNSKGIPTFVFMMLGFVTVLQFLSSWTSVSSAIQKDKPLYAFRQVVPFASIVSTALIELIANVIIMSSLCMACYLLKIDLQLAEPLKVLLYLVEIQFIAFSLGIIFGIARMFVQEIVKIEQLIQRPLIFISGTFFTLSDMPESTWKYFTWNPLLHAVELSRGYSYESFELVSAISSTYLHVWTLTAIFLSLSVYIVFWKQAISR